MKRLARVCFFFHCAGDDLIIYGMMFFSTLKARPGVKKALRFPGASNATVSLWSGAIANILYNSCSPATMAVAKRGSSRKASPGM